MFIGWIAVCLLDECVAISLAELAAKYPTSAGPYYWSFQIAGPRYRTLLSFITGWTWLIGNWTITLSVNFGFASLLAATVNLYQVDYEWQPWKLVLLCWALCLVTFVIVAFANRLLPLVDTFCAVFTAVTIVVVCVWLSVAAKQGRHSPSDTLVRILTKKIMIYDTLHWLTRTRYISILLYQAGGTFRSLLVYCRQHIRELWLAKRTSDRLNGY